MANKISREAAEETKAEMSMTPMIDITFQLLIFFMLGVKFKLLEQKLNSYLPKDTGPNSTPPPDEVLPTSIHLKPTGPDGLECTIKVGLKPVDNFEELEQTLRALHNTEDKKRNLPVDIYGSDDLRWRWICRAFDTAIGVGCEKVQFSVGRDNEGIEVAAPQ